MQTAPFSAQISYFTVHKASGTTQMSNFTAHKASGSMHMGYFTVQQASGFTRVSNFIAHNASGSMQMSYFTVHNAKDFLQNGFRHRLSKPRAGESKGSSCPGFQPGVIKIKRLWRFCFQETGFALLNYPPDNSGHSFTTPVFLLLPHSPFTQ